MKQLPELHVLNNAPPDRSAGRPLVEAGPVVWRSLEELAGVAAAPEISGHEFLARVEEWLDGPNRRDFLRTSAASLALAGLSGCAYQPAESIVPYVQAPEQIVPGRPLFFASAVPIDGFACGVLVKSEMGRPIKIEGNAAHPGSLGATDIFAQAALLGLYDPDRSQLVTRGGRIETWEHFQTLALDIRESLRVKKGAGLRILTQTVASPTLADQLHRLLEQFPEAKWHAYEGVSRDAIRAGTRLAFGEDLEPALRRRMHAESHGGRGRPQAGHRGARGWRGSAGPGRRDRAARRACRGGTTDRETPCRARRVDQGAGSRSECQPRQEPGDRG